ncbi:magnesium transporter [Staphylothermus marinus]|uniref:magnesium transporter n=1 Tax=Staphylothermus marinus TaxID=2280 RepID=UPI00069B0F8F|nr:magnesium transporter [Staphylothermus marinus]
MILSNDERYAMVSKKLLKQQFISLTINALGGFASSIFLGMYRFFIRENPWILAINPPLKDLNGNIYSSLLSRLNSGLYLGSIKPRLRDKVVISNILVVLSTLVMTSTIILFITWFLIGGDLLLIFEVALPAMIFVSIILYPFTSYSSIYLYRHGFEPESLMLPVIFLLADIITTPTLIGYSLLVLFNSIIRHIVFVIILLVTVFLAYISYMYKLRETFRTIGESQLVLIFCLFLDVGAGAFLARNIDLLVSYPFIILTVSVFNGLMGSLTSIYAIRQNVLYHIGLTSLKPDKKKLSYLPYMYVLSIYTSFLILMIGYALAYIITGGSVLSIGIAILISLVSSIVITPILWLLIQIFAYLSFKIGFDPDNVMSPILTSMIDIIGTIIYILTANLIISILMA